MGVFFHILSTGVAAGRITGLHCLSVTETLREG